MVFEAKSYFLLDTDSMVYCFLKGSSAPSPLALHYMFSERSKKISNFDRVFSKSNQLLKADGLDVLSKKKHIGSIYYDVPVSEKFRIEQTGLNEKDYEELTNQKSATVRVSLIAKRKKESTKGGDLKNFLKKIIGFGAKRIEVKAWDDDELTQSYFVENNPLALRSKFDYDSKLSFDDFEAGIKVDLTEVFLEKSKEINEYL